MTCLDLVPMWELVFSLCNLLLQIFDLIRVVRGKLGLGTNVFGVNKAIEE